MTIVAKLFGSMLEFSLLVLKKFYDMQMLQAFESATTEDWDLLDQPIIEMEAETRLWPLQFVEQHLFNFNILDNDKSDRYNRLLPHLIDCVLYMNVFSVCV